MEAAKQPVNIYCASCGAPARFDIARQIYTCEYCGAETGIREALAEKQGFRQLHRQRIAEERRDYPLTVGSCSGCGAKIVFPENEALTRCAFCGRALARWEYLSVEGFPEVLIPFRITPDEANARLLAWCDRNRGRREAKDVRGHIGELQDVYLPYEVVKGPVSCTVRREDAGREFTCRGFLEGSFVSTSRQVNNLLLNGMEPFDLSDLREFSFSYLAGQRVKIRDLSDGETADRVKAELSSDYEPYLAKAMETQRIYISPSTENLVELAAVLPAYYLRAGLTLAAVNGQTGKVAVREAKDRFLLPWQLKPIFWTLVLAAVIFGAMYLFGAELIACLYVTGLMTVFLLMVLFTAYHNQYGGVDRWRLRRRILTSDDSRPVVTPPEFYEPVNGAARAVRVRFTTPLRVLKMLCIALGTVFLPLILAFLLNGFSAEGLHIGGAAVWLCITVPIAPVYLLKFGRLDLYEHPLLWAKDAEGRRYRVRKKRRGKELLQTLKEHLPLILVVSGIALGLLIIQTHLVLHWE